MAVLALVHVKVEPLTVLPKDVTTELAPLHTACPVGPLKAGMGLSVMVKLTGAPLQPAANGVTVIVAATGAVVLLIVVKADIFPALPAPKPIAVLLFTQL